MNLRRTTFGFGAVLGLALILLAVWFLPVNSRYAEHEVRFEFDGYDISGKLVLPLGKQTKSIDCLVLVHGDGAMTHDSFGYYAPYFSHFAEQGFCSFSWDKPGVAGSEGNWLSFGMDNRARLVEKAIMALRAQPYIEVDQVGLIGFSQAGWVMPLVDTQQSAVSFSIFVSPAINWLRQSAYMTELRGGRSIAEELDDPDVVTRMLIEGATYAEFEKLAVSEANLDADAFSPGRWEFALKNIHADMVLGLQKNSKHPTLLLTGAQDGQVNSLETQSVFDKLIDKEMLSATHFETAGHSMIDVDERRVMDEWDGLWLLIQVQLFGKDAFTKGYWAALDAFLATQFDYVS